MHESLAPNQASARKHPCRPTPIPFTSQVVQDPYQHPCHPNPAPCTSQAVQGPYQHPCRPNPAPCTSQVVQHLPRGLLIQHCGAQRSLLVEAPGAAALAHHMPASSAAAESRSHITSPMTGTLVEVLVAPGDAVREGDPLVVIEAMKMRNSARAPRDGVVAEVAVAPGTAVMADALLVRLE